MRKVECAICGGRITILDRIIGNHSISIIGMDCHGYWCRNKSYKKTNN